MTFYEEEKGIIVGERKNWEEKKNGGLYRAFKKKLRFPVLGNNQ